ncbi:hypothetical protein H310_03372 [Aphanomyces invadans]|uniref:FYVE-type domain-containing protein n=1 Tax=Aphanomyces invadans TaxID=157072 RepID=A0A024UIE6_9STRA|nr:hypothetical protein H310_03372 [Aphanomyces invadans]ETW05647.1 hypothetical protein H310_03372 [Aphanomyces invadans]|eukprot:XP_008865424.1 hypothetical protein H310_03372 [Aphanomyces invadans]
MFRHDQIGDLVLQVSSTATQARDLTGSSTQDIVAPMSSPRKLSASVTATSRLSADFVDDVANEGCDDVHISVEDLKDQNRWTPSDACHSCRCCGDDFSLFQTKHHCRACGHVICLECVVKRPVVLPMAGRTVIKFCKNCVHSKKEQGSSSAMQATRVMEPAAALEASNSSQSHGSTHSGRSDTRIAGEGTTHSRGFESGKVPVLPYRALMHPDDWAPDSTRKECVVCHVKFSLFGKRRHHCRVCGEIMCKDCTAMREAILPRVGVAEVRVCLVCVPHPTEVP